MYILIDKEDIIIVKDYFEENDNIMFFKEDYITHIKLYLNKLDKNKIPQHFEYHRLNDQYYFGKISATSVKEIKLIRLANILYK